MQKKPILQQIELGTCRACKRVTNSKIMIFNIILDNIRPKLGGPVGPVEKTEEKSQIGVELEIPLIVKNTPRESLWGSGGLEPQVGLTRVPN